jgi:hypothetical protein
MWTEAHLAMIRAWQLEGLSLRQIGDNFAPEMPPEAVDLALWAFLGRTDTEALFYLNGSSARDAGGQETMPPARAGR